MEYKKYNDKYAVKISRGDDVLEKLQEFVNKENIQFAKIDAIGAIEDVTLGYLTEDGYEKKFFKGDYELISLKGSIAGNKEIHMHANISGSDFNSYGGHFFGAKVSGVIEMFVEIVSESKVNKVQKQDDLFPTWDLEV